MAAGFLFDLNKCTGCQACEIACTIENGLEFGTSWRQVVTYNETRRPEAELFHLSLACHHCAEAPCMSGCPALAIERDATTGAVVIDPDSCIGCKYCIWSCPYDAPRYDARQGVMTKCTFCNRRLEEGLDPACVSHCPTGALGYGEMEGDGRVAEVPGCPDLGIGHAIRFMPLHEDRRRPDFAGAAAGNNRGGGDRTGIASAPITGEAMPARSSAVMPGAAVPPAITLAAEWPLLLFSLIAAALVALVIAAAPGGMRVDPGLFLGAAIAGMGLGTMHLGRKLRAWRAVLNVRRSWLSREIALYSAFVGVATLWLRFDPESIALGRLSALLGLGALFAIDRVYDVVRRTNPRRLHSADVILTGPFLAAVIVGNPLVASLIGAAKLALYVDRKRRTTEAGASAPRPGGAAGVSLPVVALTAVRIKIGLLLPALLWLIEPAAWSAAILACIALGEIIDRCEFYDALDIRTPAPQMAAHLQNRLAQGFPGLR